jgi:hypothetical protein
LPSLVQDELAVDGRAVGVDHLIDHPRPSSRSAASMPHDDRPARKISTSQDLAATDGMTPG